MSRAKSRSGRPVVVLSIDIGIKNLSFCEIAFDLSGAAPTGAIRRWRNVSILPDDGGDRDRNCRKMPLGELADLMLDALNEHFDSDFACDVVLIENQPALKNGVMKSLSTVAYAYFRMLRGFHGAVTEDVAFVNAGNKLRCLRRTQLFTSRKDIDSYKKRKDMGIKLAALYLSEDRHRALLREAAATKSKLDDYCDALLAAVHLAESRCGGAHACGKII
jgi:hypothetical protein